MGYIFKDKKKLVSWIKMLGIFQAKCTAGAKVYREIQKPIAFGEFPLVLCDGLISSLGEWQKIGLTHIKKSLVNHAKEFKICPEV